MNKRNQYKTGIQLSFGTKIGLGLLFPHFSCIVINSGCSIGNNCTIFQGVTIGSVRGTSGAPIILDGVVLGPGSKIVANVKIGNNVFVAPNSVVTKDFTNNLTIDGIPAKILNLDGVKNCSFYNK